MKILSLLPSSVKITTTTRNPSQVLISLLRLTNTKAQMDTSTPHSGLKSIGAS